jgi:hypothetical protein
MISFHATSDGQVAGAGDTHFAPEQISDSGSRTSPPSRFWLALAAFGSIWIAPVLALINIRVLIIPGSLVNSNFHPTCWQWYFGISTRVPCPQNDLGNRPIAGMREDPTVFSWPPERSDEFGHSVAHTSIVARASRRRVIADLRIAGVPAPGSLQLKHHVVED